MLVVVSEGTVKPVALESALERLELVRANLLGIVLNQSGQDMETSGRLLLHEPVRVGARSRPWAGGSASARAEWPVIVLLALAVAVPTAFAPQYALAAAAVALVLAAVVFNATALLGLLVAAFPWDDMLQVPSPTLSTVKILGALLFVGYALRALARDEDLRLPPTLPALVVFVMLVLHLAAAVRRCRVGAQQDAALPALRGVRVPRSMQLVRTRAELGTVLRVLVALLDRGRRSTGSSSSSPATRTVCRARSPTPTTSPICSPPRCPSRSTWRCTSAACVALWVLCGGVLVVALCGTLSRSALVGIGGRRAVGGGDAPHPPRAA